MDFKELKKIVAYSRKNGIKRIKNADVEIEFHDAVIFPKRPRGKSAQPLAPVAPISEVPAPPPVPSLDEINRFIYGQTDEAS